MWIVVGTSVYSHLYSPRQAVCRRGPKQRREWLDTAFAGDLRDPTNPCMVAAVLPSHSNAQLQGSRKRR